MTDPLQFICQISEKIISQTGIVSTGSLSHNAAFYFNSLLISKIYLDHFSLQESENKIQQYSSLTFFSFCDWSYLTRLWFTLVDMWATKALFSFQGSFFQYSLLHFIHLFLCACVYVWGLCIPWNIHGSQRTACRNQFSPSTLGVLGSQVIKCGIR